MSLRKLSVTVLLFALGAFGSPLLQAQAAPAADDPWWQVDDAGEIRLTLYFFWTRTCPHCQDALPDVEALALEMPWVDVQSREITDDQSNTQQFIELARAVGGSATSVPAFLFCGQMLTGYDNPDGMGAALRNALSQCRSRIEAGSPPSMEASGDAGDASSATTFLPGFGEVDLSSWSLPLVAITLGALDSFNPCAFFVLLFLLSLLVNARSRARMLLIGGLFVTVSGLVYFLFMAAWLNLFLLIGQLVWITSIAGLLALGIGTLNIKDYFWFNSGPSLSIPEDAKPGLFARMRGLLNAESLPALVIGTLTLAVVANSYELLCTAGFPMVFTRILTLENLPLGDYYGYLMLYCLVYVVPLLGIVGMFVFTLGRRKLSEREGRVLKLLSGLMMAGLGAILLLNPALLNNVMVTLALLASAVAGTWLITRSSGVQG